MPLLKITTFAGEKSELEATSGETLMEALRDNDYDEVLAICGGVCSCASCHVYIEGDWAAKLPARSEDETQLVTSTEHFKDNSRLSCQITLNDDMGGMEVIIADQDY